jgi:hypothetical protein
MCPFFGKMARILENMTTVKDNYERSGIFCRVCASQPRSSRRNLIVWLNHMCMSSALWFNMSFTAPLSDAQDDIRARAAANTHVRIGILTNQRLLRLACGTIPVA